MKTESMRKYEVTDVINQNYNVQTACVLYAHLCFQAVF